MARHNPHFAAYYRWLILTQYLKISIDADSILDVGCDDGFFLSQQHGCLRVGVDLAPHTASDARLTVVQADGCRLPFRDASFAIVVTFDVLEHIPDDNAFLASITRVLAPGGCLWLSTPANDWRFFPGWLMPRAMRSWGHQRVGYDPDELISRLPSGYSPCLKMWTSFCFRHAYLALRVLWPISPLGARLGARLCFAVDRHLRGPGDHIYLSVTRDPLVVAAT
jgi:SAM-dependent methyltransferase